MTKAQNALVVASVRILKACQHSGVFVQLQRELTEALDAVESEASKGKKTEVTFDGKTLDPALDHERLRTQLQRVFHLMRDGEWRTLQQIATHARGSEASVSARLRDLRKQRFGNYVVRERRIDGGLHHYQLLSPKGEVISP